ncbi:sterol carrier family protein [Planctomonas psychrotolerans]|uniref:sterol carrier family protein n=1 Tax=Planctomonas psychrotolerans TaxID=2528712 RepID=UPI00123B58A5|nr:sterol carrier family protein [Planctomonas psychrotolerans]
MAKGKIVAVVGEAAVRKTLEVGVAEDRDGTALAVRYTLQVLAEQAPGNTLEVRVPPFGAVQCVEGPGHTRGTPPNVVETDAATWLELATGALAWEAGVESGRVQASGSRASLAGILPVGWQRT